MNNQPKIKNHIVSNNGIDFVVRYYETATDKVVISISIDNGGAFNTELSLSTEASWKRTRQALGLDGFKFSYELHQEYSVVIQTYFDEKRDAA